MSTAHEARAERTFEAGIDTIEANADLLTDLLVAALDEALRQLSDDETAAPTLH